MAADWTQLPGEPLQLISQKLPIYIDYVRFRAVCHKWRSSVPKAPRQLPPQPPWLLLPLSKSQSPSQRAFYDISTHKTHHLELPEASRPGLRIDSSNGWLVILDDSPAILLLNPLTHAQFHLPPLTSFPNVVSFDNSEVDKEYAIRKVSGEIYRLSLRKMRESFINKIVLSLDPINNDSFVAVAILYETGNLAYCKNGDQSWTFINDVFCCDVTYYKKQFYTVDQEGAIAVCDVNGALPSVSVVVKPPPAHDFFLRILHLVNSGDDELLLVAHLIAPEFEDYFDTGIREICYRTGGFDVFRMNWSEPQWEEVSLVDRVLFVGKSSPVLLSVSDFLGCLRNPLYLDPDRVYKECLENCIYYTDDYRDSDYDGVDGSDTGIYRLWDLRVFPIGTVSLPCSTGTPHSLWVTPNPS